MRIYTYLSLPGLIIHEFMHILFGALSGYFFSFKDSFTIWHRDGSLTVGLETINKKMNVFQMIMVPLAPLYLVIGVAILSFFNPAFIFVVVYFLITYFYSLPSAGDFEQVRYAKVYFKYGFNDEVFKRFMTAKSNGVAFMSNITLEEPEL